MLCWSLNFVPQTQTQTRRALRQEQAAFKGDFIVSLKRYNPGTGLMEHYSEQGCGGMDLLDLLFDQTDGILRNEELGHHGNQAWPIPERGIPVDGTTDFLNALLSGSDSVSGSPLWSPSPSDSGISEDPHSDQMDSPPPPDSPPVEPHCRRALPNTKSALDGFVEPDFSTNLADGWPYSFVAGSAAGRPPASELREGHSASPAFPLTVKDLLLSSAAEHGLMPTSSCQTQQPSHQPFQELILNDDEKKLLAKEGVTLPSKLPLTKYEERILKKIRRKIRNKQSAQESRKKKKEYIDGLESRMAACNAQNQELQRKVFQLEKRNTSLMEQLRRLQVMVMSGSNKTAQTGTCILVLVLSFSLILFPCLQPLSESKARDGGDFGLVRVQSRSLHNVLSSRVLESLEHDHPEADQEPFSADGGVEEIAALLGRSALGPEPRNASLGEGSHRHGDPITGHIATVTWAARHDTPLRSYADDM
ncbi:cyclic AMP-responsive element-binding protein 3-like protein 3-A isoform X1 [Anguilla anguilla]|uniref:cyclic AMP-responsive element-binding protein 3-like protein 3-A isoform X1 n=1 Tax=Anguilla anguilla TaxID=7936 RepID=UPI0015AF38B1|nr:cyclic AMP-responsive element-binding protein 3-like protein 3-A isoform X1 [Anguilla anguilla]